MKYLNGLHLHIFWYFICRNRLSTVEVRPTWTSTPPDLKVAVIDIQMYSHFCMNVLFCSCFKEKNNLNCLIQSKTNPGRNLGHFNIHCTLQGFQSNQINQVLKKQNLGHDMPVCLLTVHWWQKHNRVLLQLSWCVLNQLGITSQILNRLIQMSCQNTHK